MMSAAAPSPPRIASSRLRVRVCVSRPFLSTREVATVVLVARSGGAHRSGMLRPALLPTAPLRRVRDVRTDLLHTARAVSLRRAGVRGSSFIIPCARRRAREDEDDEWEEEDDWGRPIGRNKRGNKQVRRKGACRGQGKGCRQYSHPTLLGAAAGQGEGQVEAGGCRRSGGGIRRMESSDAAW